MTLRKGDKQRVSTCPVDLTIDEMYDQKIPIEAPVLISSKLEELDRKLLCISNEEKKEWMMALEKCPDLCDDNFRLMFLRCEVFNCTLASKRIVKYWAKRVQLFGMSKAFQPLALGAGGTFEGDEASLQYGMFRTTEKFDSSGRSILFCDPSRLPVDKSQYENESVIRATWYMAHAALEDETTQKKGAVIIIFPRNVVLAQFNSKLAKMFAESFKGCIPIRLSALHFCHLPMMFDFIFPLLKVLMGSHLRKKIHLISGEDSQVPKLFENKFGVLKENLPIEVGGSLQLNHEKWLKERLRRDLRMIN